jgi:VanZ family protein
MATRDALMRRVLRWLPALGCMALIFWFSSQPDLPRPPSDLLNLIVKKGAHFGIYGTLALCYLYGLGNRRHWLWALLLVVLYAVSDEYHQSWTPNRYPSALDVLIDTAGAATALSLWPWAERRFIAGTARSWGVDHDRADVERRA